MGPGLQVLLEPGGRIVNNTSQAPSQKWQQRALLANLLTILLWLCRLPMHNMLLLYCKMVLQAYTLPCQLGVQVPGCQHLDEL